VYTGWLIIQCADYCQARRYEDIALKLYGRKMARFTSVMLLLTLQGFIIAYIVLLKSLLPATLSQITGRDLPEFMADDTAGHFFWAAIFSYGVIFPMSLVRKISSLRFASLFSFFCGFYVVLALVFVCLCDRSVNPDLGKGLEKAATRTHFTVFNVFNSFPLIVFSFMYQPNLPAVYQELK